MLCSALTYNLCTMVSVKVKEKLFGKDVIYDPALVVAVTDDLTDDLGVTPLNS